MQDNDAKEEQEKTESTSTASTAAIGADAQPPAATAAEGFPVALGVGDEVIVTAHKHKLLHNGFRAKVLVVRSKDATVELLEGPAVGQEIKKSYESLALCEPPSVDDESMGNNDQGRQPGIESGEWNDCTELFGEIADIS